MIRDTAQPSSRTGVTPERMSIAERAHEYLLDCVLRGRWVAEIGVTASKQEVPVFGVKLSHVSLSHAQWATPHGRTSAGFWEARTPKNSVHQPAPR
jgi:hypothetical protein